jgi:hypothetical protein
MEQDLTVKKIDISYMDGQYKSHLQEINNISQPLIDFNNQTIKLDCFGNLSILIFLGFPY